MANFSYSQLLYIAMVLSILNVIGKTQAMGSYYVDALNGDDASEGTEQSPFRTLTAALGKIRDGPGTVYLRENQTFADFGPAAEVVNNVIVKCWISSGQCYTTISFTQENSSLLIQAAAVQFVGIIFQKNGPNTTNSLFSLTTPSTLNFTVDYLPSTAALTLYQQVQFQNMVFEGIQSMISSTAELNLTFQDTSFANLDLGSASLANLSTGSLLLQNTNIMQCTANASAGYFVTNGNITVTGTTFQSNLNHDTDIFVHAATTEAAIGLSSVVYRNNTELTNQARVYMAGGLLNVHSRMTTVEVSDSVFEDNTVYYGSSGMLVYGEALLIKNCRFVNNHDLSFQNSTKSESWGVVRSGTATLSIIDTVFDSNSHVNGGGIYHDQYFSQINNISIINSNFTSNKALYGGVIFADPDLQHFNLTVIDSNFISNIAVSSNNAGGSGGGFYLPFTGESNYTLLFSGNNFTNNTAKAELSTFGITGAGGGIFYQPTNNAGSCIMKNNLFLRNQANFGAGMLFKRGTTLTMSNNTFISNSATVNGGGAAIQKVKLTDHDSSYTNNTAQFGGGLFLQEGVFHLFDAAFTNNKANYSGGGLAAETVSDLVINRSTFLNCSSQALGGATFITVNSAANIQNTLFQNCSALQGGTIYFSENFVGPQRIQNCQFLNNFADFSLIQALLTTMVLENCFFNNTHATIIDQVRTDTNITNITISNTICPRTLLGCFLGSISTTSYLDRINIDNMQLAEENTAISFRQKAFSSITNIRMENINGSLYGACLVASNTSLLLDNWYVKNFYSGCVYITGTNANISNFYMDNYEFSKSFNNTDSSRQVGSAIYLSNGDEFHLSNITVVGNQNVSSLGSAIDVENSTLFVLNDSRFQDNVADVGGAIYIGFMPAILSNIVFFNNSAGQGGALYIRNSARDINFPVTLLDLNFTNNSAKSSGGGAHFHNVANLTFKNSVFEANEGIGSNSSSLFQSNSKGGALYYACNSSANCNATVEGVDFMGNQADIGGAIYFNAQIFYPQDCLFENNSATSGYNYGPIFASYPVQLLYDKKMDNDSNINIEISLDNGTVISRDEYIRLFFTDPTNFTGASDVYRRWHGPEGLPDVFFSIKYVKQSGGRSFTKPLVFYAVDHFGQEITVDNPDLYVSLIEAPPSSSNNSAQPNYKLTEYTEASENGAFTFTGHFGGGPGSNSVFNVTTNIFDYYNVDSILYDNSWYSVGIGFRNCARGEILPVDSNICSPCPTNSFSLTVNVTDNTTCLPCTPYNGLKCVHGGANLTVAPRYWRVNNLSLHILNCGNPAACVPSISKLDGCDEHYEQFKRANIEATCETLGGNVSKIEFGEFCNDDQINRINQYCSKILNGTTLGACSDGYEGILCGVCKDGWGATSNYKCTKCEKTLLFFVELGAFGLLRFILIAYTVYQAHAGRQDKDQSSTLRILINYFQVLNILLLIPFEWPSFVDGTKNYFTSLFGSNGAAPGGFSYECLLQWIGMGHLGWNYFELEVVYTFFSPFYWTFLIGFLMFLWFVIRKKPIFGQNGTFHQSLAIIFIVTFFYIWPELIAAAFSLFNCIEVGATNIDETLRVVQPNPLMRCYDSRHWLFLGVAGIPLLAVWGFGLPFICFLIIRRQMKHDLLGEERFARIYGFIYQGYTKRFYWWEFTILARKLVFLAISVFLVQNVTVMCLTLFLATMVFTGLQLKGAPFTNTALNSLELTSLFSLAAIIYAGLYHLSLENQNSSFTFLTVAASFTILFFVQWIGYYFIYLRKTITEGYEIFTTYGTKAANFCGIDVSGWCCCKHRTEEHEEEEAEEAAVEGVSPSVHSSKSNHSRYRNENWLNQSCMEPAMANPHMSEPLLNRNFRQANNFNSPAFGQGETSFDVSLKSA